MFASSKSWKIRVKVLKNVVPYALTSTHSTFPPNIHTHTHTHTHKQTHIHIHTHTHTHTHTLSSPPNIHTTHLRHPSHAVSFCEWINHVTTSSLTMEMDVPGTHALRWIAPRRDSQTTHAIILSSQIQWAVVVPTTKKRNGNSRLAYHNVWHPYLHKY